MNGFERGRDENTEWSDGHPMNPWADEISLRPHFFPHPSAHRHSWGDISHCCLPIRRRDPLGVTHHDGILTEITYQAVKSRLKVIVILPEAKITYVARSSDQARPTFFGLKYRVVNSDREK